jgi:hypothetical protein
VFRIAAACISIVSLAGCALIESGEERVVVTGTAPSTETSKCDVSVAAIGGHIPPEARAVEGAFRESFVINHSRRGHRAILQCGGVGLVAERTFKYGRDVSGDGEVPLVGRGP